MEQEFEKEKSKEEERKRKERQRMIDAGIITVNSKVIQEEIAWLEKILDHRLQELRKETTTPLYFSECPPPDVTNEKSYYADFINEMKLTAAERLFLICALIPRCAPALFTKKLRTEDKTFKIEHPELGGYFDTTFTGFVPTLQTALYILAGDDMTNIMLYDLTFRNSVLLSEQIMDFRVVNTSQNDENEYNHALSVAPEYVNYFHSGQKPRPDFGNAFPASFISTNHEWSDLVLKQGTLDHVNEVMDWLHASKAMNKKNKIKPGFPCLFYGPSGTGKTLTASLLGKYTGKDVFRIDLSMVVSKYIGETEKNLAHLFSRAENKDCILFFDEADSLFSKRTEINSSNDKWANLEVSYLLQRMEDYPGLTILGTNLKSNLDSAMTRRFQAMIYFGRPDKEERIKLWQLALPEGYEYEKQISFEKLAKFELTGGNIANVIKFCCVQSYKRENKIITPSDLSKAIRREFAKEGRTS